MNKIEDLKILKPVDMRQNVITSRFHAIRWWKGKFIVHGAYDFAPMPEFSYRIQDVVGQLLCKVIQIYNETDGFGLYIKKQSVEFPQLIGYDAHLREVYVKEGDIIEPS